MVKLYASLLSLTLITSLALAAPHPPYTHIRNGDLLERDLDEEFSGREYLSDAYDDLAARDPSFFGSLKKAFKSVGNVAVKGLNAAKSITDNPIFQAAASIIPGGGALMAAEKVASGAIGQVQNIERLAGQAKDIGQRVQNLAVKAKGVSQNVRKLEHLGGALGKVPVRNFDKVISRAKQVHKVASGAFKLAHRRHHHRRDLEDDEELSRRDFDDEELFEREYDDFLAERDLFDDLD